MEKIKFAIQIALLILAFPVYFYVEVNHGSNHNQLKAKTEQSTNVDGYTKNGKDRSYTKVAGSNCTIYTNTIFINSFN